MKHVKITELAAVLFALAGCVSVGGSPKVISGLSPEAARDEVRRLKATHQFPADGVVVELEGVFPITEKTFELDERDSGLSDGARVTYRAVGGGATFTGARKIPRSALKPCGRGEILACDLAEFGIKALKPIKDTIHAWDDMELFAGGEVRTLARYPNEGWLTFNAEDVVDSGTQPDRKRGEWNFGVRGATIKFPEGDTHAAKWNLKKGVWLHGFWTCDWASDSLRVGTVNPETREMKMQGIHYFGMGPMNHVKHEPRRYFAYNTLDELDIPGEWYVDREELKLYYWPKPGEKGDLLLVNHDVPIMSVKGAKFITFEGLKFKCNTEKAVEIVDCDDLVLDGVAVAYITRTGLKLTGGKNCLIRNCRSTMTGNHGFVVSGGDRKNLVNCNHRITGCDFSRPGRIVSNGNALVFGGCGMRVDNNYIHDTPYIGMCYTGNEHLVESNEIAFVMMESGDGGGIYTGRDWCSQGNVVRWNYLHHFGKSGADWKLAHGKKLFCEPLKRDDSSGIYLDDCDSGELVVSNIMFKTGRGFLIGGGRDNDIRENLMIGCGICGISVDSRGQQRLRLGDGTTDGWDMKKKLEDMDWTNGVWAAKYPWMADYLTNDPLMPVRTSFERNVAVNCKVFFNGGWDKAHGYYLHNMKVVDNVSIGERGERDEQLFPENKQLTLNDNVLNSKALNSKVLYRRISALEKAAERVDDARELADQLWEVLK